MGKALKFREEKRGPGKFEGQSAAVEVLYQLSLDGGADEEVDEGDGGCWAGKMEGPFLMDALQDDECVAILEESAGEEDLVDLATAVGAILHQDTSGFITGEFFTDLDEADAEARFESEWESVVDSMEPPEEE